jgi:nucleoside 2-deoxyribosyltransferase
VFLAAPLFSEAEQDFNFKVAKRLREEGFEVWFAQESSFSQNNAHKEKKNIFESCISALKASDVLVAVLDGIQVDAGVAFEVGFARALEKPVVGFKTDFRVFSVGGEVNLMLDASLVKICKSLEEVINSLIELQDG